MRYIPDFLILVLLAMVAAAACSVELPTEQNNGDYLGMHQTLGHQQELAKSCAEKGGLPITELTWDYEHHPFTVLRSCNFPPVPCGPLAAEQMK